MLPRSTRFAPVFWTLIFILLLACAAPGDPASEPFALTLTPCQPPGLAEAVLCGTYPVFENRAAGEGRRIDLQVVVLPARAKKKAADPIFFLHGGPGAAATTMAPLFLASPLREQRDIVLLDQRGTGASNPLRCATGGPVDTLKAILSFDFVAVDECLGKLDADPRFYTTPLAMDDLDEVRRALGAETINLWGGSYGSRAALEYMRRYPEHVRTAFLRGVAGPTDVVPVGFSHSSQAALDALVADCGLDTSCRKAFPALRRELDEVLARLDQEPARVALTLPGASRPVELTLTRELFAAALHYQLYGSALAVALPAAIHAAHGGNFEPVVAGVAGLGLALASQLHLGMTLSVLCTEDAPFIDPQAVAEEARSTPLGGALGRNLKASCQTWPRGEVEKGFKEPVRSQVPTLLISGAVDPVTPPSQAAEVARHLPNSLHVVVPGTAHINMTPGCTAGLIQAFIESGSVAGLDAACVESIRRPSFQVP
jgi:pimeloyl-ACP methyl ester carboxylesterase